EAAERAANHCHAFVRPALGGSGDAVECLARRRRQLRASPYEIGPLPVHPGGDAARLRRSRRRAKAVQIKQVRDRRGARRRAHAAVRAGLAGRDAASAASSFAWTPPKLPLLMHSTWSPGRAAAMICATSSSIVGATKAR